jgi:hypothetical protein
MHRGGGGMHRGGGGKHRGGGGRSIRRARERSSRKRQPECEPERQPECESERQPKRQRQPRRLLRQLVAARLVPVGRRRRGRGWRSARVRQRRSCGDVGWRRSRPESLLVLY